MKKIKFGIIAEELFLFSFITYLILLLAETVKEGFVSFFLDLNYLLAVVLVSGIFMELFASEKSMKEEKKKITERDSLWIIIFSIGGGNIVYYKTQELGNISLLITGITTIIIILLSLLIYTEDENTVHKE